jgi:hypothetical protein
MNTLLDTSKRIYHVFICSGHPSHVSNGFRLLATQQGLTCPDCGMPVKDITEAELGKAFFAFSRPDLGRAE